MGLGGTTPGLAESARLAGLKSAPTRQLALGAQNIQAEGQGENTARIWY